MSRNTKLRCPVCERMVTLDGCTDRRGEFTLPWHVREGFRRCEGSYRSLPAIERLGEHVKRPGVRGDA